MIFDFLFFMTVIAGFFLAYYSYIIKKVHDKDIKEVELRYKDSEIRGKEIELEIAKVKLEMAKFREEVRSFKN